MKNSIFSALTVAGLGLVAAYPAAAAQSIYLKIPGVTGPATAAGFQGDIPVLTYSQGFSNADTFGGTGAGGGASKTNCGAINIQKALDSASTFFLGKVLTSALIPTATIYFTEEGSSGIVKTQYTVVLTNLLVTLVSQGDSAARTTGVTESISLIAEKFQFAFTVGATGTPQTVGWDCIANRPF